MDKILKGGYNRPLTKQDAEDFFKGGTGRLSSIGRNRHLRRKPFIYVGNRGNKTGAGRGVFAYKT